MEFSSLPQFLSVLAIAAGVLAVGLWLTARHANRRKASQDRCLALAIEDERDHDDTFPIPLSDEDRALVELGGLVMYRPGDRIALASGRIVTGWELAYLVPDLVGLSITGDVDRLLVKQLPEPKFREAFTARGTPDDLMGIAQQVDVDPEPTYEEPRPTLGQERLYDAHDMVPYGTSMVEQGCLQARWDFATDRICPACAAVFGAVRA